MKADIVVDIETVAEPLTTEELAEFMAEYSAPANWKDPVKLAEHRERFERTAMQKAHQAKCFTLGGKRMVCAALGVAVPDKDEVVHIESWAGEDLSIICEGIRTYLDDFSSYRLIGWNHKRFDLPEIIKSFRITGTPPPRNKAAKWDVIDLCDHPYKGVKLKEVAKAFGLKVHECNGSDVAELYAQGDWETMRQYNEHDVLITGQIYNASTGFFTF